MPRTRPRVGSVSLALMAAVALTLAAVSQGGAAGPPVRYVATYRITVTTSVTTAKIGSGVADNFRGTVSFTHTYPRVPFESYLTGGVAIRGNLRGGGRATGTAVSRYDHQGDSCGPNYGQSLHESGTLRGPSTLSFGASYPVGGRRPFTWSLDLSSVNGALGGSAMNRGDIPTCTTRHGVIVVETGVRKSRVSASYSDTHINLAFKGVTGLGKAGFPLDRLLAGKGFSYASRGTTRTTQQTRDSLKNGGYAYVMDGSMRIVFTPVR